MAGQQLTERQQKWMATVRANLEAQTGKPMADWVAIAKACPETAPKKRKDWLREHHGLGVNHASFVLAEAFPETSWDDPAALRAALWNDPSSAAILAAIEAAVAVLAPLVIGQRKSFTAFSKDVQFAAARPLKGGRALLGLKLEAAASPRLSPTVRTESWSPNLTAFIEFDAPGQVDVEVRRLLAEAHGRG